MFEETTCSMHGKILSLRFASPGGSESHLGGFAALRRIGVIHRGQSDPEDTREFGALEVKDAFFWRNFCTNVREVCRVLRCPMSSP